MPAAIEILNLSKSYTTKKNALNNISLTIKNGEFFALLGHNGAGKSTAIGIISSLVNKSAGIVKIMGHDLDKNKDLAKNCIGLVPQEFNFSSFETSMDILVNQAGYYGVQRSVAQLQARQLLEQLGLKDKMEVQSRFLSGGMKRRLMIARALMHNPKILILDEPTAGVDVEVRHQIWKFLKNLNQEHNITIFLTTHYLEEAEYLCRTVAIIKDGLIIKHGEMRDVLASSSHYLYIAELATEIPELPLMEGFDMKLEGSRKLEVNLKATQTISEFIGVMNNHDVVINNIYPKSNRLEALFMKLTLGGNG
jgi:ABC-2 type transport system ATP-binding protein